MQNVALHARLPHIIFRALRAGCGWLPLASLRRPGSALVPRAVQGRKARGGTPPPPADCSSSTVACRTLASLFDYLTTQHAGVAVFEAVSPDCVSRPYSSSLGADSSPMLPFLICGSRRYMLRITWSTTFGGCRSGEAGKLPNLCSALFAMWASCEDALLRRDATLSPPQGSAPRLAELQACGTLLHHHLAQRLSCLYRAPRRPLRQCEEPPAQMS
eukprot:3047750-Pleurochrysis_carterae.AAC.2